MSELKEKQNTDKCEKLLNDIFIFDGRFNYNLSKARLAHMFFVEESITSDEYDNLYDALRHRRDDGHYRYSLIWKRAENS